MLHTVRVKGELIPCYDFDDIIWKTIRLPRFIKRTKRAANEKRTLHQFFEVIRLAAAAAGADAKLTPPEGTGARRGVLSTWLNPLLAEPFAC